MIIILFFCFFFLEWNLGFPQATEVNYENETKPGSCKSKGELNTIDRRFIRETKKHLRIFPLTAFSYNEGEGGKGEIRGFEFMFFT